MCGCVQYSSVSFFQSLLSHFARERSLGRERALTLKLIQNNDQKCVVFSWAARSCLFVALSNRCFLSYEIRCDICERVLLLLFFHFSSVYARALSRLEKIKQNKNKWIFTKTYKHTNNIYRSTKCFSNIFRSSEEKRERQKEKKKHLCFAFSTSSSPHLEAAIERESKTERIYTKQKQTERIKLKCCFIFIYNVFVCFHYLFVTLWMFIKTKLVCVYTNYLYKYIYTYISLSDSSQRGRSKARIAHSNDELQRRWYVSLSVACSHIGRDRGERALAPIHRRWGELYVYAIKQQ